MTEASMDRKALSAANLSDLLEREFQRFRATECVMLCRVPAPIFRDALGPGEANWYIDAPLSCARHCHRLIAAVIARVAEVYDLERPPVLAPPSRTRGRGEPASS
jgi:hypothetical protein